MPLILDPLVRVVEWLTLAANVMPEITLDRAPPFKGQVHSF